MDTSYVCGLLPCVFAHTCVPAHLYRPRRTRRSAYLSPMQRLPIGQQDFRAIRREGKLYIDKTEIIAELVEVAKFIFLSRPRRFGKSLTLTTVKYLFEGERELFEGLWIANNWDWERRYPVLHFQFNSMGYQVEQLSESILSTLNRTADSFLVTLSGQTLAEQFESLIHGVHRKHGPVVLLIDEYDKPIIDFLGTDKLDKARENQHVLKSFYSVVKNSDAYLRFFMITGVSKFSKVGVFSDLNNLYDISLSREFAALAGITEVEVLHHFGDRIAELSGETTTQNFLQLIRDYYNGYAFAPNAVRVYNPFGLLSFMQEGVFNNYWFATGTPTFLINLLRDRYIYDVAPQQLSSVGFNSYDLERLETVPLLYQTGYLTIREYDDLRRVFTLDYPNLEVKESMLGHLLGAYTHQDATRSTPTVLQLEQALRQERLDKVRRIIDELFATIPYQLFVGAKENLYHAVIHVAFTYLGQYVQSEVSSLRGRLDAAVVVDRTGYLFEFKLDGDAKAALQQMRERGYRSGLPPEVERVVGIGVNFSSEEKRVTGWEVGEVDEEIGGY